jgi:hypothetical protein
MRTEWLEAQLHGVAIPDGAERRAETLRMALGRRDVSQAEPHLVFTGRRLLLGLAAAVALVGCSLTPPGRTVTGAIGRLVGIGDAPSPDPGDFPFSSKSGRNAVVVGTGVAPGGHSFEVVASGELGADDARSACIGVHFLKDVDYETNGFSCLNLSRETKEEFQRHRGPRPTAFPYLMPASVRTDFPLILEMVVPPEINRISFTGRDPDGSLVKLSAKSVRFGPGPLAEQIGTHPSSNATFAFAFVPPEAVGSLNDYAAMVRFFSSVRLTEFGSGGSHLRSTRLHAPGAVANRLIYESVAKCMKRNEASLQDCAPRALRRR